MLWMGGLAGLLLSTAALAQVQSWAIDGQQSKAGFWLRPAWIKRIDGTFPALEGVAEFNAVNQSVRVDVRIDVRALQMSRTGQVEWAHSPEFFDVERHPWIRFQSLPTSETVLREGGTVEGEITLRGNTRSAQFTLQPATCAKPGFECPVQASGQIRRSLFGMDAKRLALGDTVHLEFSLRLAETANPKAQGAQ